MDHSTGVVSIDRSSPIFFGNGLVDTHCVALNQICLKSLVVYTAAKIPSSYATAREPTSGSPIRVTAGAFAQIPVALRRPPRRALGDLRKTSGWGIRFSRLKGKAKGDSRKSRYFHEPFDWFFFSKGEKHSSAIESFHDHFRRKSTGAELGSFKTVTRLD
jgi:hypothetical protein